MKVKKFIKQDNNIDVYDDIMDGIGIAVTTPVHLTAEGKMHFKKVLNFNITFEPENGIARLKIKSPFIRIWTRKQAQAIELFYAIAGYCDKYDYCRWFV